MAPLLLKESPRGHGFLSGASRPPCGLFRHYREFSSYQVNNVKRRPRTLFPAARSNEPRLMGFFKPTEQASAKSPTSDTAGTSFTQNLCPPSPPPRSDQSISTFCGISPGPGIIYRGRQKKATRRGGFLSGSWIAR
jgi:hypothetical protein